MPNPVDDVVRAVMRALHAGSNGAAECLDDPGFHGSLRAATHRTLDGTLDVGAPRISSQERDIRVAVARVLEQRPPDTDWRTGQPLDAGFHGSLDPRDFFGI